jgi:hypothetical protein
VREREKETEIKRGIGLGWRRRFEKGERRGIHHMPRKGGKRRKEKGKKLRRGSFQSPTSPRKGTSHHETI